MSEEGQGSKICELICAFVLPVGFEVVIFIDDSLVTSKLKFFRALSHELDGHLEIQCFLRSLLVR